MAAESKKEEEKLVTFLNQGKRHFDWGLDDKKQAIRQSPGEAKALNADQAKIAARYPKELVDISKLPGVIDTSALKADNAKLKAEKEALLKQLAALTPKADSKPEPKKEEKAA